MEKFTINKFQVSSFPPVRFLCSTVTLIDIGDAASNVLLDEQQFVNISQQLDLDFCALQHAVESELRCADVVTGKRQKS
jgi:hypothetical protein